MAPADRSIWEIIAGQRANRAIVLTTHSMEEADELADQVAIIAGGRTAAIGSPQDLKFQYGTGYTLTVVLDTRWVGHGGLLCACECSPSQAQKLVHVGVKCAARTALRFERSVQGLWQGMVCRIGLARIEMRLGD